MSLTKRLVQYLYLANLGWDRSAQFHFAAVFPAPKIEQIIDRHFPLRNPESDTENGHDVKCELVLFSAPTMHHA